MSLRIALAPFRIPQLAELIAQDGRGLEVLHRHGLLQLTGEPVVYRAAALGSLAVGVIGPQPDGGETDFEVRAFAPGHGVPEDPVTGSLNAGLAQWLIGAGLAPERYTVTQGTAMGRSGLVRIFSRDRKIWVGGETATCIDGTVSL